MSAYIKTSHFFDDAVSAARVKKSAMFTYVDLLRPGVCPIGYVTAAILFYREKAYSELTNRQRDFSLSQLSLSILNAEL